MKVAILHEMLVKFGGAEKVVQSFQKMYPEADLYTLIFNEKKMGEFFPTAKVKTPKITQRIYNLFGNQRFCLPFMARAVESLDFSKYDMVICSSSGFAHGAITKPECKFIVYCHAPARYLWDWTNEYKKEIGANKGIKSYILNKMFLQLRVWDFVASKRSDITFANSSNTALRIKKYHKKNSIILYPPIEIERFQKKISEGRKSPLSLILSPQGRKEITQYYIIISALTEFKRLDVAIKGFNSLDEKLVVIGAGEYREELEKLVEKDNIIFTGAQYGNDLVHLVQNSLGLIFPGEEDFGMVPVEALAAGKPVFALSRGGLLETVEKGVTGEFFDDIDGKDFIEKFTQFHNNNLEKKYKEENCIKKSEEFSEENFEKNFKIHIK